VALTAAHMCDTTPRLGGVSLQVLVVDLWRVFDGLVYPLLASAGSLSIRCTGAPGMMVDIACL
jgi:hypothetical protein